MLIFRVLSTLIWIVGLTNAARILAAFSSLNYADHLIYRGYIKQLAAANHHVIVMTAEPGYITFPEIEKIVEISVQDVSAPYLEQYKKIISKSDDHYEVLNELNELALNVAKAQLQSPQMSSILVHPDILFDLVVTEADMPLLYALSERYKAPHVSITASTGKLNMYDAKGNPNHAILYPDVFSLKTGRNMTIFQKLEALKRHVGYKYSYYHDFLPKCQQVANQIFGEKIKELQELEYDIDILFISGTPMMIGNRPTVPAIIYVDRLHIQEQFEIPEGLQNIMDSSEKGVIYFSLGATFDANNLSKNTIKMFIEVFKELPYTVLWQLENYEDIQTSSNVYVSPWLPQQEILAHKNLKAFITNGGPRSVEEAIYFKVPVVGVPFVKTNRILLSKVSQYNAGIVLEPSMLDQQVLKEAILQAADNSSFKTSMDHLQNLVFDQPMTGAERAVWWTEYVMRHKGAKHLRAPAVGVPLWKYFMLDVIGTVLLVLLGFLTMIIIVVRKIYRVVKMRVMAGKTKWKML